jgi:hypothetical protein
MTLFLSDRFHAAELLFYFDEIFGLQFVRMAQGGEEEAPCSGDDHTGDAASDYSADGAPPVRGETALIR